jgi:hypothetical protein
LAAWDLQGPVLPFDRTRLLAVGAGLFGAQRLGLLFQEGGEGSFGQAGGRGRDDCLHGLEIDVQARTGLPEDATRDDFAPLGSELADFLELLRGDLRARHGQSCFVLTQIARDGFLLPFYQAALGSAKGFLPSEFARPGRALGGIRAIRY